MSRDLMLVERHRKNEEIVTNGLQTFYEVGMALAEIRDSKSYKLVDGFDTFEAYCIERWDMPKPNAHRVICCAKAMDNLVPIGTVLPTNEGQARELTKLKTPEEQQSAWKRVLELADTGKKVTAKLVKSVVDEFTAPEPPEQDPPGPSKEMLKDLAPQGLEREALELILKEAKRGCSKKCHPDVNPNGAELMAEVNRLLDEIKKYYGMNFIQQ